MKMKEDDKLRLAEELKRWRGYAPARVAAEVFGISRRTVEAIEQGRGFVAAKLLRHAMATIECPKREID